MKKAQKLHLIFNRGREYDIYDSDIAPELTTLAIGS